MPGSRVTLAHGAAALLAVLLSALLAVTALRTARPAAAAAGPLVQVSSFGSNPGALAMYTYTPANLPAGAALVVALHGCTQTAHDYFTHSGWAELADRHHFAVVFAQQSSANHSSLCFNWYTPAEDSRGVGEAASVKSMVDHQKSHLSIDPARVFVTGLSAGGAMTANLLADYPDVFAAGATDSGLPTQCATTLTQATSCQRNNQNLTPSQWAAKVKNSYPGYTGRYPRIAIWQGSADYTVYPVNGAELRDQWTAVHGLSQTPSQTLTLGGGATETIYRDGAGTAQVALFSIAGMGHGTAVDPGAGPDQCGSTGAYFLDYICSSYHTAQFWGLIGTGSPTPTSTAPTPTPTPTGPCVTASNYAHTSAGRAHQLSGKAYANGSNQDMGLWNTYITHTLRQTGADYWVIADGQC
ncbi:MAG TPA: PHB depolymerase family esterase [Jatrophihabitans sp.]|jgi:poly(hydroxyalkanoate) depolymerase family esterase|uniref:extracellular catalytic domain type 1 short-chain-length polyhydroxyalkanoate depolymerase n=1 Tax=Jatrophihabitans sp. TaxID=1932789 RepID=UPI002EE47CDB